MLEYVIELHAYDFVIKGFVMKKGCYCVGLYIYSYIYIYVIGKGVCKK